MTRATRAAVVLLMLMGTLAVAAPLVSPWDPNHQTGILTNARQLPSLEHPLGTDHLSRDMASRILHGARVSLTVALVAVSISVFLGTLAGMAAALGGPLLEGTIMRLVDAGIAMPRTVLLISVFALWDAIPLTALVVALGCTSWFQTCRLVRSELQSMVQRPFVRAAVAAGAGRARLVLKHLLPGVMPLVIVSATLGVANIILVEAGLSFLGIGVAPPDPSWGSMIRDGYANITAAPWMTIAPGAALALTVASLGILGDHLQLRLTPGKREIHAGG